jgi:hypothetical protein
MSQTSTVTHINYTYVSTRVQAKEGNRKKCSKNCDKACRHGTVIGMEVKIDVTNLANKPTPQHDCIIINGELVKPILCLPLALTVE